MYILEGQNRNIEVFFLFLTCIFKLKNVFLDEASATENYLHNSLPSNRVVYNGMLDL